MIVFVFACFPLEERISKEFNLDTFFRRQAHTLTAMHVAYQAVVTYNNLYLERNGPSESVEEKQYEDERATIASYLGFSIYIAGAIYIVLTLVRSGCYQKKPQHQVSICCGLIFLKICMLLGGKCGVMVYVLFVLTLYVFVLMIRQRQDRWPGQSLELQIFYTLLCINLCFLRTGHRDRFSSIKVGQVCPGYTGCPVLVHHALSGFDALCPYLLGLMLFPMVIKANDQTYTELS